MNVQIIGFGVSDDDMEFDGTSLAGGAMRWRAPELYKPLGDNLVDFTPVLTLACDVYSLGSLILQVSLCETMGKYTFMTFHADTYRENPIP